MENQVVKLKESLEALWETNDKGLLKDLKILQTWNTARQKCRSVPKKEKLILE